MVKLLIMITPYLPSGPIERHVDFELGLGTLEIQTSKFNTQEEDKNTYRTIFC